MAAARLTVVANEVEAEVICGLLRGNGLACTYRITDVAAAGMGASGVSMGGPTEVLVDEADLDAARELLTGA